MTTRNPPPTLIALIRAIEARYSVTLAKDETK
jgi:hypothetical protein